MAKLYFNIIFFTLILFATSSYSQSSKMVGKNADQSVIDGLNIFPNPVTNGKVTIVTKVESSKDIVIFDVLGKKVFQTQLSGRELNVSDLVPGVYIIKINEDSHTATRKLIVR